MTRKERQERSRREIYHAALQEFGAADFDAVTMDSICMNHKISKGMLYHYYANKDELFLSCAGEVFQSLNRYLQSEVASLANQPVLEAIKHYFLLREFFFQSRPQEKHIFENAVFYPPKHLAGRIRALRQPIHEENDRFLRQLLSRMELREGLDRDLAARYLNSIYAVFWTILEQYCPHGHAADLHDTLCEAEKLLNMLLFGVVKLGTSGHSESPPPDGGTD